MNGKMTQDKMIQVLELFSAVKYTDLLVSQFFDLDSEKNLDQKIKVLSKLKNGIPPSNIPDYYDILELYPRDGQLWD
ncbi:MAG: hypothetical protein Q4B50_05220 [Bacillota bacterium]|nr:hypothetical protein [Bacillota bacterium]